MLTNSGSPRDRRYSPPIYPSYPPPYPAPLRGIQIQIRVVDPTNQRIKSLTIRQDFTDKLDRRRASPRVGETHHCSMQNLVGFTHPTTIRD